MSNIAEKKYCDDVPCVCVDIDCRSETRVLLSCGAVCVGRRAVRRRTAERV